MSVKIHRPLQEDATNPPRVDGAVQFGAAVFHEVKPRSMRELIGDTSPASAAVIPAASPAVAAEAPPRNNWRKHIGNARLVWNKLSTGELERVGGDQAKLVKLLSRHYSYDRHEAGRLVKSFFERNRI